MHRTQFSRQGIYRSRDGVLLGVCRGIADHFDLSPFWIRFGVVIIFFLTGLWPVVGLYIAAALLMKPEPVETINTQDEQDFYNAYVHSPGSAMDRLKRKFEKLDRRIRRMEDKVTNREFDWERRCNDL